VKDQYFGDVNDFRKYGLIRILSGQQLRVGFCWMLTAPDGGNDGDFLRYLRQPKRYRQNDPALFDWLDRVVAQEKDRRTVRIENAGLLDQAAYHSEFLTDSLPQRDAYFAAMRERFTGCDLVFFDPDNGVEVRSVPRGRRKSSKFVYWQELCSTFASGASILIYQHFIRERRDQFIARMVSEAYRRLNPASIFTFRTPHVLFLLAAQERHATGFRSELAVLQAQWSTVELAGKEWSVTNRETAAADACA
jgi:hypothetical protein